jgi:hypothetical protein
MSETDEDDATAAVTSTIADLSKQIHEFTFCADKYFGIALTTIVAVAGLAVAQKLPAALAALPIAIGGILFYVLQLFTERAARMGMRRYLEEWLQKRHGQWHMAQESCLREAVSQERASVKISTILYGMTYLVSCVVAVRASAGMSSGAPVAAVFAVAYLLMCVAMLIAIKEMARAEEAAYRFMKSLAPEDPSTITAAISQRPRVELADNSPV